MPTAGDITEITFNHPKLGSFTIFPIAEEDGEWNLGGLRSADEDAGIDGGGNMIDSLSRTRWSVSTTVSWDMNVKGEVEKLIELAASPELSDITISNTNGTVYGGKGKPVGDLTGKSKNGSFPVKLAGGGVLKKIVG